MKITFDSNNSGTLSYTLDSKDLYNLVLDHKDELFEIMHSQLKEKLIKEFRKKYDFEPFGYTGFQLQLDNGRGVLVALYEHPHCGKEMTEEKVLDEEDSKKVLELESFYVTAKKILGAMNNERI